MNLKRIVSVFRRKKPAPTEDSLTLTDEQLKKAKVSFKTLERDILEQKEIRRIETPRGRRAFFRGVAGVVGLKVLAEKVPKAYFEDNFLDYFPEVARFIPEAEGHDFYKGCSSIVGSSCPKGHRSVSRGNCVDQGSKIYCRH